jgi:hypothetical protein
MIFAALCLNCAVFGSLMRPLELVVTNQSIEVNPVLTNPVTNTEDSNNRFQPAGGAGFSWAEDEVLQEEEEDDDHEDVTSTPVNQLNLKPTIVGVKRHSTALVEFIGSRNRSISDSVTKTTTNRLQVVTNIPTATSPRMKRNVSTPGFGRLARMDSTNEKEVQRIVKGYNQQRNRKESTTSFLFYGVQVIIIYF